LFAALDGSLWDLLSVFLDVVWQIKPIRYALIATVLSAVLCLTIDVVSIIAKFSRRKWL